MKKSTRNADARSKSTTKRPFKSAYAVEKHDENEKVAPPHLLSRTVLLRTKKKKKKKKEKRYSKVSPKTKRRTKRQPSALRKQRMTRKRTRTKTH